MLRRSLCCDEVDPETDDEANPNLPERCCHDVPLIPTASPPSVTHPAANTRSNYHGSTHVNIEPSQPRRAMPCLGSDPWSVHTKQSKALAESARDQPPRNPIKFNPLVNVNPRTRQSERAGDRKIAAQSAVGSDPGGSLDLPQGLGSGTTGHGHRLGIRQSGVGTCGRIAICNLLRPATASRSSLQPAQAQSGMSKRPQRRLLELPDRGQNPPQGSPKARRWLLKALGPCLRPGIRHGADGVLES